MPITTSSAPEYFFDATDTVLNFNLHLNLSDRTALESFFDILDVTEFTATRPVITINYNTNKIQLQFKHLCQEDKSLMGTIIEFIEKIQEYGMTEKHENKNALWFYGSRNGDEILKFKNYPIALQNHLASEQAQFISVIQLAQPKKPYTVLVEVGCGAELENMPIAQKTGLKYLGIEFSAHAAHLAQQKISKQNIRQAHVKCYNILHITPEKLPLTQQDLPIFIFPFNLLGNIAPISLLFSRLRLFGNDFIASIYRLDEATKKMRLEYYSNCGYKDITATTDSKNNVTFSSPDGLYSVAYNETYLEKLLTGFGFEVSISSCSQYGVMLYAKAKPWAPILENTSAPILTGFTNHQRSAVSPSIEPSDPAASESISVPISSPDKPRSRL